MIFLFHIKYSTKYTNKVYDGAFQFSLIFFKLSNIIFQNKNTLLKIEKHQSKLCFQKFGYFGTVCILF